MRSPQQLAEGLVRQWQRAEWREQHLLPPPDQAALDRHLRAQARGRLEQEFLPANVVAQAVAGWRWGAQPKPTH